MNKKVASKTEDILEDIYALDASLRNHDAEVRLLVSELVAAKPEVNPDRAFIAQLRTRVLAAGVTKTIASLRKSQNPTWLWWALRIAPVGVVAVLTLALVQQPTDVMLAPSFDAQNSGREHMQMDSATPATLEAPAPAPEEISPSSAGKRMMPYEGADGENADTADQTGNTADTMMMQSEDSDMDDGDEDMYSLEEGPAVKNENVVDVFEQRPGTTVTVSIVTLAEPGFVRVYAHKDGKLGGLLGTSAELAPGTLRDVPVTLSRPLGDGEVGYAQLFSSDGDSDFQPDRDLPLYDEEGGFVYTLFVVTK